MNVNVGGLDRIIRIAAGAALIILAQLDVVGMWGWLGVIPLAAGLSSIRPSDLQGKEININR